MNYRFEIKPRSTRYTTERVTEQGTFYRTQCELAGGFNVEASSADEGWRIACTDPRVQEFILAFNLTQDDFEVGAVV